MNRETLNSELTLFSIFLFRLLKNGEKETITTITNHIIKKDSEGVVEFLCNKYSKILEGIGFSVNSILEMDEFFTRIYNYNNDDGRKSDCTEDEGLWYLLELIIENMHLNKIEIE